MSNNKLTRMVRRTNQPTQRRRTTRRPKAGGPKHAPFCRHTLQLFRTVLSDRSSLYGGVPP